MKKDLTRRGFLSLAGVAGLSLGATALAGCSAGRPSGADNEDEGDAAEAAEDMVSAIEPLAAPEAWDNEVDVVVAGTGGGLSACLRAAQLGASVMAFDPAASWGGSSKETDIINVMGSKYQEKMWEGVDLSAMGMPGMTLADVMDQKMGGHDAETQKAALRQTMLLMPGASFKSITTNSVIHGHIENVNALIDISADWVDWVVEAIAPYGVTLGPVTMYGSSGLTMLCPTGAEEGGFVARTNYTMFEAIYNASVEAGVQYSFNNGVVGLVVDEAGAVIGVKTADGKFTKANKGVILATGGMASNRALLERYCPAILNGSYNSSATMNDDGSGIRMGLGVGGVIDGLDSAAVFDGGIQTPNFNHYLYKGDVQFARNVPSLFNVRGERVPWYSLNGIGFTDQAAVHFGQPGGFSIAVADADYERIMNESTEPICRKPITPEMCAAAGANVDRLPEAVCERDWRIGFQQGIEGGWIVQADTIAELAEKLGVNAENLQRGVDQWNAACEAGVDETFGLDPALLRPIAKAPFVGLKVNGTILSTNCGLAVDFKTGQVIGASGDPIEGLYAAGTTVGGISGTGSLSCPGYPAGCVCHATASAWQAANAIMGA